MRATFVPTSHENPKSGRYFYIVSSPGAIPQAAEANTDPRMSVVNDQTTIFSHENLSCRRTLHLAADHLAPYAERLCALRVVESSSHGTNTARPGKKKGLADC